MEFSYPINMTRTEAFIRRANKFIEWLHKDEYRIYAGEESMKNLARFIGIISHAFNHSMQQEDWEPFYLLFRECKLQAVDAYETEEARQFNFDNIIVSLLDILEKYKDYIPDHVIGEGSFTSEE